MQERGWNRDRTGRVGIHAIGKVVEKELGWIFREQPASDYGIDAQIEVVYQDDGPTGRLIALQIKSGESYLREKAKIGFIYRGKNKHLQYWTNHSLPVVIVVHDPNSDKSYWQVVKPENVKITKSCWKMTIPSRQKLDKDAAEALEALANLKPYYQHLDQLILACPWMEILQKGARLLVQVEDWRNTSSRRRVEVMKLIVQDVGGAEGTIHKEERTYDWPVVVSSEMPYEIVVRQMFPWANVSVDAELYRADYEEEYDEECGVWDSETQSYIMHTKTFQEWWESRKGEIQPVTIELSGARQLQMYPRFELKLNSVGRAFLVIEEYLNTGMVPPDEHVDEIGEEYPSVEDSESVSDDLFAGGAEQE